MISWRRIFGVDLVEMTIWAAASFLTTLMVVEYYHDRMPGFAAALLLLLAFGARRHAALKTLPPDGETSGSWRMADVDSRLAELEAMQTRVAELEERVDFAERLLARQVEAPKVEVTK